VARCWLTARLIVLCGLALGVFWRPVAAQSLELTTPQDGQVLNGVVLITGHLPTIDTRYNLHFAYDPNPSDTWFALPIDSANVGAGELGVWDTSQISPGTYQLRLQAFATSTDQQPFAQVFRGALLVGELSAATPAQPAVTAATVGSPTLPPLPTLLPTAPLASPTPQRMPLNLPWAQLGSAFGQGVLFAIGLIVAISLYRPLRRQLRPLWRAWLRQLWADWRKP
jgi:hypothetical protein